MEDAPVPIVQAGTGMLLYNGPHCMGIEDERLEITHGMHKDFILRLDGHIKTVLYYPKIKSCTVLYSKGICRYNSDELKEDFRDETLVCDVEKLLHGVDVGVYVGVCKRKLKLLSRSFQLLCQVETPARVTASAFNSWSGEVVTASPGNIMVSFLSGRHGEVVMARLSWYH